MYNIRVKPGTAMAYPSVRVELLDRERERRTHTLTGVERVYYDEISVAFPPGLSLPEMHAVIHEEVRRYMESREGAGVGKVLVPPDILGTFAVQQTVNAAEVEVPTEEE